jgi:hypothetical protein
MLPIQLVPIQSWHVLVQHGYRIVHRTTPTKIQPAQKPSGNLV